jgi:hypothetical protein
VRHGRFVVQLSQPQELLANAHHCLRRTHHTLLYSK